MGSPDLHAFFLFCTLALPFNVSVCVSLAARSLAIHHISFAACSLVPDILGISRLAISDADEALPDEVQKSNSLIVST